MNILKFIKRQRSEDRGPRMSDAHPARVEVLIVEDKKDEADMLVGLLRFQEAVIHVAVNLAEALEYINGPSRYHLAFVDLNLPNGSGIEAVRRIKDSRRMTHVIVVSGAIEKIPLVVSYGYVGLLGKPYTIDSIREILWKHRLPSAN
jgi:CheY-like chemotaxis protein